MFVVEEAIEDHSVQAVNASAILSLAIEGLQSFASRNAVPDLYYDVLNNFGLDVHQLVRDLNKKIEETTFI